MLYIVADTHGEIETHKLSILKKYIVGDANPIVIVAGDFGLVWRDFPSKSEQYWRDWLDERSWTTLFVDGNHENHELISRLPSVPMFGAEVGKVSDKIYHLKRGQVYTILGRKVFTFGGALSIDIENRIEGISWWRSEVPNWAEMNMALDNLEKVGNKVDLIVAHTCPRTIAHILCAKYGVYEKEKDSTTVFLEHIIQNCSFDKFYFGHWHLDWTFGKYVALYQRIERVEDGHVIECRKRGFRKGIPSGDWSG